VAGLSESAEGWRELNRANWEARVPLHVGPGGYDLDAFDDPSHLSDVVRFDLPRLGPIEGLDVVHLQCHIGTDTVSLARLGAASVTGLDFSPTALDAAAALARRAGVDVRWIEADLYDAVDRLGRASADLVFTGVGALCWLPSIDRWAGVVSTLLRPGGRLFIREGHPVLWALADDADVDRLVLDYPYFEVAGGTSFTEPFTYAGEGTLAAPATVQFNHGLGEIVGALLGHGLQLVALEEHQSVPWNPLGESCVPGELAGEFVLRDRPERLPLSYTLQAVKPSS
jgi:SAM-dependent methyltransferase